MTRAHKKGRPWKKGGLSMSNYTKKRYFFLLAWRAE